MERKRCALSTTDNKFNPITQFIEWYVEDVFRLKHNTCGVLADNTMLSSAFPDPMLDDMVERVIDDLVKQNKIGEETNYTVNYIKVVA